MSAALPRLRQCTTLTATAHFALGRLIVKSGQKFWVTYPDGKFATGAECVGIARDRANMGATKYISRDDLERLFSYENL
jgi:hypothetical protein